jgi:hypothetical protein
VGFRKRQFLCDGQNTKHNRSIQQNRIGIALEEYGGALDCSCLGHDYEFQKMWCLAKPASHQLLA